MGAGGSGRGRERNSSRLPAEHGPDAGLDPVMLRSRPEPNPRVGCSADQAPLCHFHVYTLRCCKGQKKSEHHGGITLSTLLLLFVEMAEAEAGLPICLCSIWLLIPVDCVLVSGLSFEFLPGCVIKGALPVAESASAFG